MSAATSITADARAPLGFVRAQNDNGAITWRGPWRNRGTGGGSFWAVVRGGRELRLDYLSPGVLRIGPGRGAPLALRR